MDLDHILLDWRNGNYKPVYWLEGEEPYYIDKLVEFAETQILKEEQISFNLLVFYGKDSKVDEVINACRRYPMFSEKQVVILKEAQHMREIEKLESYIEHPLISTLFIVSYKEKKLDGRKTFGKLIAKKAVLFSTKKFYDNELPEWTSRIIKQKKLEIQPKALQMLVDHIGNDLQRIENEIDKLSINLNGRKSITEYDIENFVGISKEYNIFELQDAICNRDLPKALNILNYFASNPKSSPIQLILPTLYAFFSKLYIAAASHTRDEFSVGNLLGLKGFPLKNYMVALKHYSLTDVENSLLMLHQCNLKSLGIGKPNATSDAQILLEMTAKIILRN